MADGSRKPYSTRVSFLDLSPLYMAPICGTETWDSSIKTIESLGR